MGSEVEIRDALTNLIFNAVDAMPDGGTLTLRTRIVSSGPPGSANPARQVTVEVSDTGVGMDEETRRRCLEPFYTTKGERGTGLGLAMVYGMIQRHSAELEIDSALRRGTTVRLIFAAADPLVLATTEGPQAAAATAAIADSARRRRSDTAASPCGISLNRTATSSRSPTAVRRVSTPSRPRSPRARPSRSSLPISECRMSMVAKSPPRSRRHRRGRRSSCSRDGAGVCWLIRKFPTMSTACSASRRASRRCVRRSRNSCRPTTLPRRARHDPRDCARDCSSSTTKRR